MLFPVGESCVVCQGCRQQFNIEIMSFMSVYAYLFYINGLVEKVYLIKNCKNSPVNVHFTMLHSNCLFSKETRQLLTLWNNCRVSLEMLEMWWLIASAPDFWGGGPGFESGNSHNDPDALHDHWDKCRKSQGREGNRLPLGQKNI